MNGLQKPELLSCYFDEQIMYENFINLTCQSYQCNVQTLDSHSKFCTCGRAKRLHYIWIKELRFNSTLPLTHVFNSIHYCGGGIKNIKIELSGLSKGLNLLNTRDDVLNMTLNNLSLSWMVHIKITHTTNDVCNQTLELMFFVPNSTIIP